MRRLNGILEVNAKGGDECGTYFEVGLGVSNKGWVRARAGFIGQG